MSGSSRQQVEGAAGGGWQAVPPAAEGGQLCITEACRSLSATADGPLHRSAGCMLQRHAWFLRIGAPAAPIGACIRGPRATTALRNAPGEAAAREPPAPPAPEAGRPPSRVCRRPGDQLEEAVWQIKQARGGEGAGGRAS